MSWLEERNAGISTRGVALGLTIHDSIKGEDTMAESLLEGHSMTSGIELPCTDLTSASCTEQIAEAEEAYLADYIAREGLPVTTDQTEMANNNTTEQTVSRIWFSLVNVEGRRVTSGFSHAQLDPVERVETRAHLATDYAGDGNPIYAVRSGTITFSGWSNTGGNMIIIEHENNYKSRYLHMAQPGLPAETVVQGGQEIGIIGNTGRSRGPHLHFVLTSDGEPIDAETGYWE